jgi:hypothetical protein
LSVLPPEDVLTLTDAAVAWLEAHGVAPIDRLDLDTTYRFKHELNGSRRLDRLVAGDHDLLWRLLVYEPTQDECIFEGTPLARRIIAAAPLYGRRRTRGLVALNAAFFLKAKFQGRCFATCVYAREEDLYRRWGIREIQLNATSAGPVVWIRKFGFMPRESGALALSYTAWARERGQDPEPPADPANYPVDFLKLRSHLTLYKVLQ